MGFLDDLKDKAGDLGGRAKDGLAAARGRAANLVEDVRDRMDRNETPDDDTVEAAADHSVDSSPNSVQQAAEVAFYVGLLGGLVLGNEALGDPT